MQFVISVLFLYIRSEIPMFAVHSRNGSRINAQKRKVHARGTMRKFDTTVNDAVTSTFTFFDFLMREKLTIVVSTSS